MGQKVSAEATIKDIRRQTRRQHNAEEKIRIVLDGLRGEETIVENTRSRKRPKRGRKRWFNAKVYKRRFSSERTFAWIDKFRALLVRFDRKAAHFLGAHYVVYALINLRHLFAEEKSQ